MESDEPLLKLHREFTDKEKLANLRKQYSDLSYENVKLRQHIQRLEIDLAYWKGKIKKDRKPLPGNVSNVSMVSGKVYNRLRKEFDDLRKQYEALANNLPVDKL